MKRSRDQRDDDDGFEFPPHAKFEHAAAAVAVGAVGGPGAPRVPHSASGGGGFEGSAPEPPTAGMNKTCLSRLSFN